MDVRNVIVDFLSAKPRTERTRINYQQKLDTFAAWCASQELPLERITSRHVHAFLSWLVDTHKPNKAGQAHLSSATTVGYVRVIKACLYWCLRDDEYSQYLTYAQIKNIERPTEQKVVKQAFSHEEADALFAAAAHPSRRPMYRSRDTAILSLLIDCGLRAAELCTLSVGNVTLAKISGDDSYIRVLGKGNKEREVSLGDRSRRALARYLREYRRDAKKSEPVFISRYNKPLTPHALEDMLRRLAAASTMPDMQVNPHKCRHTFSTMFMAQGGNIFDLSKMLGHSSVATTENYLRSLSARALRTREKRPSVLDNL